MPLPGTLVLTKVRETARFRGHFLLLGKQRYLTDMRCGRSSSDLLESG